MSHWARQMVDQPNGKIDNDVPWNQGGGIQSQAKVAEGDCKPCEVENQSFLPHVWSFEQVQDCGRVSSFFFFFFFFFLLI